MVEVLENVAAAHGFSRKEFFWPLRIALTGQLVSPSAAEMLAHLPTDDARRRVDAAIKKLGLPTSG
jgi:glutamyl/glutaminyl-tRNA synthetase